MPLQAPLQVNLAAVSISGAFRKLGVLCKCCGVIGDIASHRCCFVCVDVCSSIWKASFGDGVIIDEII